MSRAYYNDNDVFVCDWLCNLIGAGLLPDGDVDERSIADIEPTDLKGYNQAHFFAGIGGWPYALRLAGWPDARPVWTGSCPCQPFSAAGKRLGTDDARHLWPKWFRLIEVCRPSVVFGEQVAGKAGRSWLAAVRADLEGAGYGVGCADLPACSVGAPHIRQRLWFVANAERAGWAEGRAVTGHGQATSGGSASTLDNAAHGDGRSRKRRTETRVGPDSERGRRPASASPTSGVADSESYKPYEDESEQERRSSTVVGAHSPTSSVADSERDGRWTDQSQRQAEKRKTDGWADCDWLPCRDGKARPVEPGTFPLAHGIPGRVGRLRAYGNAITPQVAAEFVKAYMDCRLVRGKDAE